MSTETLPLQRYSLSGATMGTRYSAVFYATGEIDQAAIQADLQWYRQGLCRRTIGPLPGAAQQRGLSALLPLQKIDRGDLAS